MRRTIAKGKLRDFAVLTDDTINDGENEVLKCLAADVGGELLDVDMPRVESFLQEQGRGTEYELLIR